MPWGIAIRRSPFRFAIIFRHGSPRNLQGASYCEKQFFGSSQNAKVMLRGAKSCPMANPPPLLIGLANRVNRVKADSSFLVLGLCGACYSLGS